MFKRLFMAYSSSTANSFKSKSKLTEFYKAIHPDMLGNAPDNIKMENNRSLKMLNGYFDAVTQNQRTEAQQITFYVANKSNTKARKFYPITLVLDAFLQKNMEQTVESVTKQIREKLSEKQQEIRTMHIKKKNDISLPTSDDYERVKVDFLNETSFIKRESLAKQQERDALNLMTFGNQTESQFIQIEKNIMQQMRRANLPYVKPRLWTSLVNDKSNHVENIISIFQQLIDPRLIYIDQQLSNDQVEKFKNKLLPNNENVTSLDQLSPFFKDLEQSNPQICLYVTKSYGFKDIPGYFSIPYNFENQEIFVKYSEMKDSIIGSRKQYETELNKYEQLLYRIVSTFTIPNLKNEIILKNSEILKQLNLSLLVLQNQLHKVNSHRLNIMRDKQWIISNQVDKVIENNETIYIPIPFSGTI